jgi:hypothetical protein
MRAGSEALDAAASRAVPRPQSSLPAHSRPPRRRVRREPVLEWRTRQCAPRLSADHENGGIRRIGDGAAMDTRLDQQHGPDRRVDDFVADREGRPPAEHEVKLLVATGARTGLVVRLDHMFARFIGRVGVDAEGGYAQAAPDWSPQPELCRADALDLVDVGDAKGPLGRLLGAGRSRHEPPMVTASAVRARDDPGRGPGSSSALAVC